MTLHVECYSGVAFASLYFFVSAFRSKYRNASRWIRSLFCVFGLIGLAWSGFGFWLLFYSTHLGRQSYWSLYHIKAILSGIALGILISLFLSEEFWRLARQPSRFRAWLKSMTKAQLL
jgi:cell shape-determining protein MreD